MEIKQFYEPLLTTYPVDPYFASNTINLQSLNFQINNIENFTKIFISQQATKTISTANQKISKLH